MARKTNYQRLCERNARNARNRLRPGDLVKYRNPAPGEEGFTFVVLEAHYTGDATARVHAQLVCDQRIKPVETVAPSELVLA